MEMRDRLHLIGSIPLDSSEQVFRRLSDELGPFLRCMPDGETGERSRWVYFQRQMLLDHPAMEIDPTVPPYKFVQWDGKVVREIEQVRFKPGVDPATVTFETGYDKAALASWETFKRLRTAGAIPAPMRFQVSLPTPQASGYLYVSGPARETYFGVYERALKSALANIVKAVPAADLSIQWDVCQEVLAFENYFKDRPPHYKKQIFDMLGAPGRRRAGRRRDGLSPVLRLAARRAPSAAQGRRHPGRDDERHRRRYQAADRLPAYPRSQGPHRRRLLCAAQATSKGPEGNSRTATRTVVPSAARRRTRRCPRNPVPPNTLTVVIAWRRCAGCGYPQSWNALR